MKQENKKIILGAIIALIIIAGIVVVNIWGFNKELRFEQSQMIEVNIEQKADRNKVKEIANEVLGMHNITQTVSIYEDSVIIRARNISEEQKNNIVNKLKENYKFEQLAEKVNIKTVPATRIRDMFKQYIKPLAISSALILVYMMIRYRKKGIWKVCVKTILIPIVAELLLLSWMAIARIPLGRITPVLIILIYMASILYVNKENEK